MTKAELSFAIAAKTGVDQPTVLATLEGMMSVVKESLAQREPVYLRGFGTFGLKHRAEKTARNISQNTTMKVPAHDLPHFKPCKDFIAMLAE